MIHGSFWISNMEEAEKVAHDEHKLIALNFSGSDWCAPCIRMRKEIFESEDFSRYATNNLIMVNADFPRLKKNQLSRDKQKYNEVLAEKYNSEGTFPCTLLLDSNGNVLFTWKGYYNKGAESFTNEVKQLVKNYRNKR